MITNYSCRNLAANIRPDRRIWRERLLIVAALDLAQNVHSVPVLTIKRVLDKRSFVVQPGACVADMHAGLA